jgi:hypothetical protein
VILAWQVARGVAWLKKLVSASESIAGSLQQLVAIERQRTPARRDIKKAVVEVASVADWNRAYDEAHPVLDAEEGEVS